MPRPRSNPRFPWATFRCGYKGPKLHRAKLHRDVPGASGEGFVKSFLAGSVCPVCQVDFVTRARAVQHLRLRDGRQCTCRWSLEAGLCQPVAPEVRAAADAADLLHGQVCRRSGVNPLAARGRGCRGTAPVEVWGSALLLRSRFWHPSPPPYRCVLRSGGPFWAWCSSGVHIPRKTLVKHEG